jgi:hypothetical protein
VVVYVRTVEKITDVRLFARTKGKGHTWDIVAGNDEAWAMLEKRARRVKSVT